MPSGLQNTAWPRSFHPNWRICAPTPKSNAEKKNILIDEIGGHDDHIHVLMRLSSQYCISYQMQLLKGESARWANKTGFIEDRFTWGCKYYAVSVSDRARGRVKAYIRNQAAHHAIINLTDELQRVFWLRADQIDMS